MYSCGASKRTVNHVEKVNLSRHLEDTQTDDMLDRLVSSSSVKKVNIKHQSNLSSIHKELMKNGINKKLLWTEYLGECCLNGESPFMYSQFLLHSAG